MTADDVLEILSLLENARAEFWVDGGWGVDALLGQETRTHDDLDLVVRLGQLDLVRRALTAGGFTVVLRDWLPATLALADAAGRSVDLHPVTRSDDGGGDQLLGADQVFHYPAPGSRPDRRPSGDVRRRSDATAMSFRIRPGREGSPRCSEDQQPFRPVGSAVIHSATRRTWWAAEDECGADPDHVLPVARSPPKNGDGGAHGARRHLNAYIPRWPRLGLPWRSKRRYDPAASAAPTRSAR